MCKQSLVPAHSIIIRRLKNESDSCHLSLLNHLDQKIMPKLFFFTSFLIFLCNLTFTEKCFVSLTFVPVIFPYKCRTCPKSPILDKPRLVIGSGQSLWSRHLNLFLSNVLVYQLFVSFLVKRKTLVKQCLNGVVCQLLVAFNFAVFVRKKKVFIKIYLKRCTSDSFLASVQGLQAFTNIYKVC